MDGKNYQKQNLQKNAGSERKISIKAARKMLGMIGRNYSDDDIRQVLNILYGMAEEAYDIFCEDGDSIKDLPK